MLVIKFGGTSVSGGFGRIIEILKDKDHKGNVSVMVVSALSEVTDKLINIAESAASGQDYSKQMDSLLTLHKDWAVRFLDTAQRTAAVKIVKNHLTELSKILDGISLLSELSVRSLDLIMSFGERISAAVIAKVLADSGIDAEFLDARHLVITDNKHGKAAVLQKETEDRIKNYFKSCNKLQVVTGFIGSTIEGHTTTFGRDGSDLTAAVFAAALGAEKLEIWSDVDGILTSDPKYVKNAFLIEEISYIEAMEISHFGAQVLFPPSVKSALEKGVTIFIRNTFNPSCKGTKITKNVSSQKYPIRGISSINNAALIRLQGSGMVGVAGFSARVFGCLARKKISVMLITQSSSEYSICFALLPEEVPDADAALKEEFYDEIRKGSIEKPIIEKDLSIIAVVGSAMKSSSGISGKFFHALGRNGINIVAIAQGSSETNISAVISKNNEAKALNAVHDAFFFAQHRSVNLFLVGTGHIGGTLLEQIADTSEKLARNMINVKLIGAANYYGMVFNADGLDPKKTKKLLNDDIPAGKAKADPFVLSDFIAKMSELNLPNSCFCDCTASDDVASSYEKILLHSIPIVTPNKKANSSSMSYYKKLISFSRQRGIPYLYETTVGAGLPVISTLRDLSLSGDKVIKIEAVLSGTLSFIFNNFDGSKPFSALVREAKAKGYTEPDPRDDLNAMDAARKALILAREISLNLEFKDIKIEPILPSSCLKAKDVDEFFAKLEESDSLFEKRRAQEEAKGKVLRYVAVIENGKAKLSLRGEEPGSPFLSLVDSDNIVVITTERYSKLPMVIKGPGAGAQVTAGGIFADIVRTARTLV